MASAPGDLVLDSFAGSGTTGHAVLKLNAAQPDKAPRHCLLVEMEPKIAREVTAERVRRVAQGYTPPKGEAVAALGGGFRYCTLGEPLFDAFGKVRDGVKFAELARHVFFTETGEPLPGGESRKKSPLVGAARGVGVYLLFNGVVEDLSPGGGNVLTPALFAKLPPHDGPKVIYAAACRLSPAQLKANGIVFKQTPYQIRTR